MHKLKDLLGVLRKEITDAQAAKSKILVLIGQTVVINARKLIGKYQTDWGVQGKLADSTVERKIRKGFSPPPGADVPDAPLYETGEYAASIEYYVQPMVNIVEVGSDLDYAPYLEYGTSRQPPRPIFKKALILSEPAFNIMVEKMFLKRLGK